jgi:ribose 5-phosphate isomerase B
MNVLVLGSRIIGVALAHDITKSYLNAIFDESEERFVRRLDKVKAIERLYMPGARSTLATPQIA